MTCHHRLIEKGFTSNYFSFSCSTSKKGLIQKISHIHTYMKKKNIYHSIYIYYHYNIYSLNVLYYKYNTLLNTEDLP